MEKGKITIVLVIVVIFLALLVIALNSGHSGNGEYKPKIATRFSKNNLKNIYEGDESETVEYTIEKTDNENMGTMFEVEIEPLNPSYVQVFLDGNEGYNYTTREMKVKGSKYSMPFSVKGRIVGNADRYTHKVRFKVYWNNSLQKEDIFEFEVISKD